MLHLPQQGTLHDEKVVRGSKKCINLLKRKAKG
jgi:hypothetical protein